MSLNCVLCGIFGRLILACGCLLLNTHQIVDHFQHFRIAASHAAIDPVFTVDDHARYARNTVRPTLGLSLVHAAAY